MIIGLLGPSCSGKSFFLKSLRALAGFSVPMSVTTRPQRKEEFWHLRHVSKRSFEAMKSQEKLCFITDAFHNSYACLKFEYGGGTDVALIITRDNIPELRGMGGVVVKIIPHDAEESIRRIASQGRKNKEGRIQQLRLDLSGKEDALAEVIFENRYDEASLHDFLALIQTLKQIIL
jgi:guanylate kinase